MGKVPSVMGARLLRTGDRRSPDEQETALRIRHTKPPRSKELGDWRIVDVAGEGANHLLATLGLDRQFLPCALITANLVETRC